MQIEKRSFGKINDNEVINYIFTHNSGFKVEISPFGATIINIESKDRNQNFESVVLGFDEVNDYVKYAGSYFGCIVGRVAGRFEMLNYFRRSKISMNKMTTNFTWRNIGLTKNY